MRLTCDLCGNILTATEDPDLMVCSNCGMEYGPDRLQEKCAQQPAEPEVVTPAEPEVVTPAEPVQPAEPEKAEPKKEKGKPVLRRVMRWMAIFAVLDLIVGVKVTGLMIFAVILLLIIFCKPWG